MLTNKEGLLAGEKLTVIASKDQLLEIGIDRDLTNCEVELVHSNYKYGWISILYHPSQPSRFDIKVVSEEYGMPLGFVDRLTAWQKKEGQEGEKN